MTNDKSKLAAFGAAKRWVGAEVVAAGKAAAGAVAALDLAVLTDAAGAVDQPRQAQGAEDEVQRGDALEEIH